jgi:hypothetical protein
VEKQEDMLYWMLLGLLVLVTASAFLFQGTGESLTGFIEIQKHPARLIQDFTVIGGAGGALLNASMVALISLILIRSVGVQLSGPTIAAFFTLFGFGLLGKTPLNILPVMFGVYLASRIAGRSFKEYILIALFGTALGPLVSFMVIESGLPLQWGLLTALGAGTAVGILLPSAAMAMLHLHQGYNLYNIGLTSGFVGLFIAGILRAAGQDITISIIWGEQYSALLFYLVPAISIYLMVWAVMLGGRSILPDALKIQKLTGRLPSDFMDMVSNGGALLNTGMLGLLSWGYVIAVQGDLNGPVLGGIFTVMGFGVFGKHLRNCLPIMAGVALSILVFGKGLSDPGPLLAALFATTLAPLAGEFGITIGVIAGFTHLVMVEQTASWHGGIDLYNNGFAGGLSAALIYAVIEWYRSSRPEE